MDYLDYFLHLTWTMVKMKRWLQGWVLSVMEFKCSYKHKIIPTFEDTAKCRLLLLFKGHGKKKMEDFMLRWQYYSKWPTNSMQLLSKSRWHFLHKFILNFKGTRIAKTNLRKNKLTLLNFKTYYKITTIKTVCYWHKARQTDQWDGPESPGINPHIYDQLIFWQGYQDHSVGNNDLFHN